ncbi:GWxTD domain-containing protein, partial [Candidatus Aminicenantes bacterium AC-335-G13]|nr:GWxTD domain-containing protein [Candidatus Aminicenantes bacterium AC-335-G13]
MKKRILISLIFISIINFWKTTGEELPLKYKKWLEEEVVYIITPTEKEVFLQLNTNRERELFIRAFWKQRDPTPGTPKNEFKEEHYRRLNYANSHFGREASKPGWKTDRGRIYIILGEPQDIERIIGENGIYNTEIWFYQGLTKYGLPPAFYLIFFQKFGVGEYVLYSPINDGPQALLSFYIGDYSNYISAYKALKRINPKLAKISLSLIPGESSRFLFPSLSSDLLIQNILSLPQREFKDIYAKKFLMYKDVVEVEYSINYIESNYSLKILKDPSGINFVHYVVEIPKFSVQKYKDKYSTYLKINGNISNLKGKTVYQFERSFTVELNEFELKKISYSPFNLYDMFPLLPGNYKISIIIKNASSNEFTSLEEHIIIPDDKSLYMTPLILGYKKEFIPQKSKKLKPFKIGDYQIYHQPTKIFQSKDRLIVAFQILNADSDTYENGIIKIVFFKDDKQFLIFTKKINEYSDELINFIKEFSLSSFSPAHYKIKVSLFKKDKEILSEWDEFEITPAPFMPRPWVYHRTLLPPENPIY